jgi:hypothetical protein
LTSRLRIVLQRLQEHAGSLGLSPRALGVLAQELCLQEEMALQAAKHVDSSPAATASAVASSSVGWC